MPSHRKVLLGMSGGVDSSVSAILLLEQGYEVIGAFMKNWSGNVNGPRCADKEEVGELFEECKWKLERRDAARVAAQLGIPFITFDFEEDYRHDVVEYMFSEFEAGRTPNPDVMCNKHIKFDRFVKEADRLGCDFVATGHYARVVESWSCGVVEWKILAGMDRNKDQTYFLWAIDCTLLPRILFPIGHLIKSEVRAIAKKAGVHVAEKKDSTGICFIGEVPMRDFLSQRIRERTGDVVTVDGTVVGTHAGINFYTIGQRHGLHIGGGQPYYVVEKRPEKNELIVSSNYHPALFSQELTASQMNWFCDMRFPFRCKSRIRYRQPLQACVIQASTVDRIRVKFDNPQRAVTPGQSIVFYDAEEMIGGGIIENSFSIR